MNTKPFNVTSGAMTYWSLSAETDPDILLLGIEALGLPKYAPKPRTNLMALKAAASDKFTATMVRSLKHREANGYTVVSEIKGDEENDFPRLCNVAVAADGTVNVSHYESGYGDPCTLRDELQAKTDHFKRVLPAASVSNMLIEIATTELGGITLRDGGGLYFIPEQNVGKWMNVCAVVEAAAVHSGSNCMSVPPLEMNEMTLRDLKRSIIREIGMESDRIQRDLVEKDLGDRGSEFRLAQSEALLNRMEMYESILGETLTSCRQNINKTLHALSAHTPVHDDDEVFEEMYA